MLQCVRLITQVSFLAVVLQGCALPLDVDIYSPALEKTHRVVHLPDGRPIELLRATFRVKGPIDKEFSPMVIGYKCGGDRFTDSVGAGLVTAVDGVAFLDFPEERLRSSNFNGFNLETYSFDICFYISVPDFPNRRESNTIRIDAEKVSQVVD
jgi:hypothetical protein